MLTEKKIENSPHPESESAADFEPADDDEPADLSGSQADPTPCCERCRAPLPPDAPEGICPACLMKAGLAASPGAPAAGFEPPTVEELAALFPQFEIVSMIGRGGMGAVYKARHGKLDRLVALKVLPPEIGADPILAERFAREAKAMARLTHPGIVMIHDYGEVDAYCYLVLEHVEGRNLREVMAPGLKVDRILEVASEVCDALDYAHREGVVHRDVKPENILIDQAGRVRIVDFGLAKVAAGDPAAPASLTATRDAMGTVHYMAPEQLESPEHVDRRADVYSVGVILYEMLTGSLPLGKFPPPSAKRKVRSRIDEIVMRALERDPDARFPTIGELRARLDAVRRRKRKSARRRAVEREMDELLERGEDAPRDAARPRDDRGLQWQVLIAGAAIFIASFLPWAHVPFETGLVKGAYLKAWAWNTSLAPLGIELPNWLIAIDGAVLALLAGLALGRKLDVSPMVYFGASAYALVHAAGAFGSLLWAGSTIQLGMLFTTGGAVTILVAAIRMLLPRESKPIPPMARRTEARRHGGRPGRIADRWRRR